MRKSEIEKCTEPTYGRISSYALQPDSYDLITVTYTVNGKEYVIKENVYTEIEGGKFFGKAIPVLGNVKVGTTVNILYNPLEPEKAYLPDNEKERRYVLTDIMDLFKKNK